MFFANCLISDLKFSCYTSKRCFSFAFLLIAFNVISLECLYQLADSIHPNYAILPLPNMFSPLGRRLIYVVD